MHTPVLFVVIQLLGCVWLWPPIWNQPVVPCPVLTVASWPAYRFLRRQVRWFGISISWRIFHSLLWPTVKGFGIVNKKEIDVFLELSCFLDDPRDVGNWSLVPLPFLNPPWTSRSSQSTCCWRLAWRIVSITLLVCEMTALALLHWQADALPVSHLGSPMGKFCLEAAWSTEQFDPQNSCM